MERGAIQDEWPLVGRDEELTHALRQLRDPAAAGVVIMGATGVGRTRLGDELIARVAAPVIDVPATRSAASIPFGAFAPFLPADGLGDGDEYVRLRRGADAVVGAVPEGERVVVHVDDAHLLDDASAALLLQLSLTRRVALLLTLRTGAPQPDALVELWKDSLTRIELEPLDRAAHDEMLEAMLGGSVEGGTAYSMHAATGGNPQMLRELVVGLRRAGTLVEVSGLWIHLGPLGVPQRLSELVELRLEELSPAGRELVDLIALGEPVAPGLVSTLGLDDALAELQRARLVRVRDAGLRTEIRLEHPVHRHVASGSLTTRRRQELLRHLAGWIRTHGARRREDVRRHALWSAEVGDAADAEALLAAAQDAGLGHDFELTERLARLAVQEGAGVRALHLLGRVLDGLGRHDEAEEVFASTEQLDMTEADRTLIASARADNLFRGLGRGDAAAAVVRSSSLSGDTSGGDTSGGDAGAEADVPPLLAAQLANFALFEVRFDEAMAMAEPLLDHSDQVVASIAALSVAMVRQQRGEYTSAVEVAERGLAAQRRAHGSPQVPEEATCATSVALSLAGLGHLDRAFDVVRPVYEGALAEGSRHGQAWAGRTLATLHLSAGRWRDAERFSREAAVVYDELSHPLATPSIAGCALALATGGDVRGAEAALADADARPPSAIRMLDLDIERARAWVHVARDDLPTAVSLLAGAAEAARSDGRFGIESTLRHDLMRVGALDRGGHRTIELGGVVDGPLTEACVQLATGLLSSDGELLDDAALRFAELGALLFAAEASNEASIAHRSAGSTTAASASRRRCESWASDCGDPRTPMLAQGTNTALLTRREREIAGLAASGRTTREIAALLVVSPRTVDNHLQRVYGKLGISRRTDLAEAMRGAGY